MQEALNKHLRTELPATKDQVKKQDEHINDLYNSIDALEQYWRKNSVEILGIPEDVCENEEGYYSLEFRLFTGKFLWRLILYCIIFY